MTRPLLIILDLLRLHLTDLNQGVIIQLFLHLHKHENERIIKPFYE